ncbi:MAG TPA: hypothetical protein VM802_31420 [Chitinophaga sp.]|uniref:hypothetical protein n=1 Tax=Chitinophaga sp. TaxID=1869181 RepID=UPI002BC3F2B8|nr:hypothetical protein [Chitinophaga sp.]HVI49418.1 hypothetical protein [Chitinophaga sp.]
MKENKFVVDLGDLKLTDEQRQKINSAIQKAVTGELAILANGTTTRSVFIPINKWPHPPIWGFVIRDFDKVVIKDSVKFE